MSPDTQHDETTAPVSSPAASTVVTEDLIEEVSIDGMCGVY